MNRIKYGLTKRVYRQFVIWWIVITIILLLLSIFVVRQRNINTNHTVLGSISNNIAGNIDRFIDRVLADVNAIPSPTGTELNCKKNYDKYLEYIAINHPELAGITIHDRKNQLTCSSIPDNKNFIFRQKKSGQAISSPVTLSMFNYPIYLIRKNFNNYEVELIVLEPMFKGFINTHAREIQSIALYDQDGNSLLKINYSKPKSWVYDTINPGLSLTEEPISATVKLRNIKEISVVVTQYHQTLFNNLWYNELMLSTKLVIISFFLYLLVKNILREHYSLPRSLKRAIKKKQFYPVYQPLYNANTGTFTGAEILLRWKDSDDEIIMPDLFIKEAEISGLIVPITLQIMDTVFKETKTLLNGNPNFQLSFNVSELHFSDPAFFDKFYQILSEYAILPEQIMLEITERNLLDVENKLYIKKMKEVRAKGFSLAVDDFGTGHASISYLQSFPFNFLKIDKLFIHAIGTKAITESLNDAIIDLGKKINVTIIAEGVETSEQVEYLLKNGVHLMQGWYFSRALSIHQLRTLLRGEI